MRVSSYSSYHSYVGKRSMTINVQFQTNDFEEGLAFQKMVDVAYKSGQEVDGEQRTITTDKIFRCGDATTVIWKDGTKTTVKLMKGADDSDYGAFTAALAKKIYGSNSKVMRYAGMVRRVKSKAEKKAERKAKHKADPEDSDYKKYIVSQYGQVAEYKDAESESFGTGQKVFVDAKTEDDARVKACMAFEDVHGMNGYLVYSDGDCFRTEITERDKLGKWCYYSIVYKHLIRVFARDSSQALKVLKINPAPIPF